MARLQTAAVLCFRYLFLTRFSWLLGLLLVMLVPLCRDVAPSLLANLLVLDRPEQVFHVSWITFWCAATVMETLRVTTLNAQHRFEDYRDAVLAFRGSWGPRDVVQPHAWYRYRKGWLTFLLGLATAGVVWWAIIKSCIVATAADPSETWLLFVDSYAETAIARACWLQAGLGLGSSLVILLFLHALVLSFNHFRQRRWRLVDSDIVTPAGRIRRGLHRVLGPGYFREIRHPQDASRVARLALAPGHVALLTYTLAFGGWYIVNYVSATGERPMPTEDSSYPALFYGLLSLLLAIYLLPGFAFFFDRFRIPVSLLVVFSTLCLYGFFGTDHYYELNPQPERTEVFAPTDFVEALEGWRFPRNRQGKRTLVVVDASGGGIQAAAWTAQVLTGLHEEYGNNFTRSIALISAVSGGSVGSMYYVINRSEMCRDLALEREPALSLEAIRQIRRASRASALEASTWGLAYPDTMRLLFPPAVPRTVDRGWSVERVWRQRMWSHSGQPVDLSDVRLSELAARVRAAQLPVVVFNATLAETGQRLLIAPVLSPPPHRLDESLAGAVELLREFPDAHLRLATAARLSATFPYVAPAARASRAGVSSDSLLAEYHVVDGGYVDNEGAVTSVDWINRLLLHYSRDEQLALRPFDDILLLRIQAFPAERPPRPKRNSAFAGWRAALVGPLDAMMNVRRASQTERGDLEISLLTQATRAVIEASQQRYTAEMKAAQAALDAMQIQPLPTAEGADHIPSADAARSQLEQLDRRRSFQMLHQAALEKKAHLESVRVLTVSIDFHPREDVRIPLSWKLTRSQKQSLDDAWRRVVTGDHPHRPLDRLDTVFQRRDAGTSNGRAHRDERATVSKPIR